MPAPNHFTTETFIPLCDLVAGRDKALQQIIKDHGYPPMWQREPGFATLIHIILEQQVSLASAKAALHQLTRKIGTITPAKLLKLNDDELRACYFSRQKTVYARELATALVTKKLNLSALHASDDAVIRNELKKIKGIGDWTVDVYLMMALQRIDFFPLGDIALVNSLKKVKQLQPGTSGADLLHVADSWRPYRTIAAYLLWHAYLSAAKK